MHEIDSFLGRGGPAAPANELIGNGCLIFIQCVRPFAFSITRQYLCVESACDRIRLLRLDTNSQGKSGFPQAKARMSQF